MKTISTELKILLASALLLLTAAFALYASTFGNSWTYDDFTIILENPDIRSLTNFIANAKPGRPLRELSYLLDFRLFGLEPAGWHLQSILLHGFNALLVFALARRLQFGRFAVWAAALLFLVHPLQVEVVANLGHRKESLVLAFSLLSVLAYARAFDPRGGKAGWLTAAFALAGIGLLAKQNAAALPIVFLAYEACFVPEEKRFLLGLPRRYRLPLLFAVVAAGLFLWWSLFGHFDRFHDLAARHLHRQNYFGTEVLQSHLLLALKCLPFLAGKLFWPYPLAVEYTLSIPTSWLDLWVVGALLLIAFWGVALVFSYRRLPVVFFALVWVGIFWLPTSNLLPVSYYAADRYLHVPAIGFFLLAAWGGEQLVASSKARWCALGLLLILLSVLTWQQNLVWRSVETLWRQSWRVNPQSVYALNNMGNIAYEAGDRVKAFEFYEQAGRINPLNPPTHFNLGMCYEQQGRRELAIRHYKEFVQLNDPEFRSQVQEVRGILRQRFGVVE